MEISITDFKVIKSFKHKFDFDKYNVYLIYGANGVGKTTFLNYLDKKNKKSDFKFECIQSIGNSNFSFGIEYFDFTNSKINEILAEKQKILENMTDYNKIVTGNNKYNMSFENIKNMFSEEVVNINCIDIIDDYDFWIDFYQLYFYNKDVTDKDIYSLIRLITEHKSIQKKYGAKLTQTERVGVLSQEKSLLKLDIKIGETKEFSIDQKSYYDEIDSIYDKKMTTNFKIFFETNIDKFPISLDKYRKIEADLFHLMISKNLTNLENICSLTKEYSKLIGDENPVFEKWNKVKKEYESTFINSPVIFSVEKDNDGIYYVKFTLKNRPETIINNVKTLVKNLSASEQRSVYLFDLMCKTNEQQNTNNTIFVFDDIADTFDELNQNAISYYIDSLEKRNYKIIILTHNYNFFKILKLKLYKKINLLFQNSLGDVHLAEFSESTDYIFKSWFNDVGIIYKPEYMIALSSVCRELNNIDNKYPKNSILKYVHYKQDTESAKFIDYIHEISSLIIFDDKEFAEANYSKPYMDILLKTCEEICSKKNNIETISDSIVSKICLAIGIRMLIEKHMVLYLGKKCLEKINSFQTKKLIDKIRKSNLKAENPSITTILTKYDIASSNIIHLNSFNYEVLFHYNLEYLICLYNELSTKSSLEEYKI